MNNIRNLAIFIVLLAIFGCAERDLSSTDELIELIEPADSSTVEVFPISFDWTYYSGAIYYRIRIFEGSDLTTPYFEAFTTSSSYELSDELPEGNYYWQVSVSTDGETFSIHSDTAMFIVSSRIILYCPDDRSTINASRVYLDWGSMNNANGYCILLWRTDSPESILFDRIEFNSNITPSLLLRNGNYRWCVGVRFGQSDFTKWSDTAEFTVFQIPFRVVSHRETYGYARDVSLLDGYAYVADGGAGLSIINYNESEGPIFISNHDWAGQYECRGIHTDGEMDIIVVADYLGSPHVIVFDVSERTNPIQINGAWIRYCEDVSGMWMRDTFFILASDRDDGLTIFDMGTAGFLNGRGDPFDPGICRSAIGQDTFAFVAADEAGIFILNIAIPEMKRLIGQCDTPGQARRLAILDNYLYVADGLAGLTVIDISDPSSPSFIYNSDVQLGDARDVEIATFLGTNYLALATGSGGVLLYDLTIPSMPYLVQHLDVMYAYGVGSDSRAFYIADRDYGIVCVQLAGLIK